MSASGCVSKCSARVVSSSAIWRFSSAMMPTVARVVAATPRRQERGGQLLGAQRGLDLAGACGDVALTPTAFEC